MVREGSAHARESFGKPMKLLESETIQSGTKGALLVSKKKFAEICADWRLGQIFSYGIVC